MLAIGQWVDKGGDVWERAFDGNKTVIARFEGTTLVLSLSPTISSAEGHVGHRNSGGALFELAARVAERCNAGVVQHSNVGACGQGSRVLAEPGKRFAFEALCPGFQSIFTAEDAVED